MVASLPAMALAGRISDRAGRRPLLLISATMLATGFAWLSSVDGFASLFTALLVLSAASGAYDVGANAVAMDYERITGLSGWLPSTPPSPPAGRSERCLPALSSLRA
jgi:MFS family permease